MKKIILLSIAVSSMLLLSGCVKGPITQVSFDTYTMKRYTNNKTYAVVKDQISVLTPILYEAKQTGTGTTNSLLISKIPVQSGIVVKDMVDLNVKQLQAKLVNYKGITPKALNVKCDDVRLTGYRLSFSFDFTQEQKFYDAQYFFGTEDTIYVISFQSITSKDITAIEKSFKNIVCK